MDRVIQLKKLIGDEFWNDLSFTRSYIRNHPIDIMIKALTNDTTIYPIVKEPANKLADSIFYIHDNHSDYFERTWQDRILQTKDDYNQAVGTCGEYRCRHLLEISSFKVEDVVEKNGTSTPDFRVFDYYNNELYVEVMTPRMSKAAEDKLLDFHSKEKLPLKNGQRIRVDTITINHIQEGTFGHEHILTGLFKRLLSNKGYAKQVNEGDVNILWLNFEDSDLHLSKEDTFPSYSKKFKDIYNTGNFGIWQVFYGCKGTSFFRERTWLKYYHGLSYEKDTQEYDGFFRNCTKWSGVVFSFNDCQVFYQNPWSNIEIPKETKQCLMRLNQFDLNSSWIDINNEILLKRIESKIEEMERVHDILLVERE